METLLLIDGNAIMHRAFHALPPLTSKDGTPTNVIYGFISMTYKVITDFKPDYVAAAFDTPEPTFRNKMYKEYQANRPKAEDSFIKQIPLVKEALDKANVFRVEKPGYEADDVIGTITKIFNNAKVRVIILTGDKDIMQLVNENTYLIPPLVALSNTKIYDTTEVERRLDVSPSQIPDFKALSGDPSDNYPGAQGIGPKTASSLLSQFHTLEEIYNNIDALKSEKIKNTLAAEKENVLMSKKLATIKCDVDITVDINQLKFKGFSQDLKEFLEKYQINSLVKRLFEVKKSLPAGRQGSDKKSADQIGLF